MVLAGLRGRDARLFLSTLTTASDSPFTLPIQVFPYLLDSFLVLYLLLALPFFLLVFN